jgi:alkanesulfonate monooxygenase SsuD/methylene tetrahydromethanopterin reductase-like flavin-dependent oxidoreductase (luciferase family)
MQHSLSLGILLWGQATTWAEHVDAARRIDLAGYDHLWAPDHLLSDWGPPDQALFESWTTLAALAATTGHVRLGHLVGANTLRPPALVAKMAATVDHISGGRFILGLGSGWFELEHVANGIELGAGFGERLQWLDESVGIIRALLEGRTVSSDGGRYHLDGALHAPVPQQAHLPLMIGGVGERRTLRIVARHADMWNGIGTVAELRHKNEVLLAHCAAVGRDPAAIERSVDLKLLIRDEPREARRAWDGLLDANGVRVFDEPDPLLGPPDLVAAGLRGYLEAGFRTIIVELPAPYDIETIERLVGEVPALLAGV